MSGVGVVDEDRGDSLFFEQSANEVVICFAVLHAICSRHTAPRDRVGVVGAAIRTQDLVEDDFDHVAWRGVLPDARVRLLAAQLEGRRHVNADDDGVVDAAEQIHARDDAIHVLRQVVTAHQGQLAARTEKRRELDLHVLRCEVEDHVAAAVERFGAGVGDHQPRAFGSVREADGIVDLGEWLGLHSLLVVSVW